MPTSKTCISWENIFKQMHFLAIFFFFLFLVTVKSYFLFSHLGNVVLVFREILFLLYWPYQNPFREKSKEDLKFIQKIFFYVFYLNLFRRNIKLENQFWVNATKRFSKLYLKVVYSPIFYSSAAVFPWNEHSCRAKEGVRDWW